MTITTESNILAGPFQRFFNKFVQGSYPLFAAALGALIWANISHESYHSFWHTELALSLGPLYISKSIAHWIDEALMTVFFFTVGLEIKREILVGGLSTAKQALLPITAAIGGMIVPAGIYAFFNHHTPGADGWGIPMATDIAFSLAVLALLGKRIPFGLKLFLTAFAIADDLGAVIVIALFYTSALDFYSLLISGIFVIGLFLANRFWIRFSLIYFLLGFGLWIWVLKSGVHATVAGVLTAMFIPARAKYDTDVFVGTVKKMLTKLKCDTATCGFSILLNREHLNAVQSIDLACRDVETPLQRIEHLLSPWISYAILPLFAFANTGIYFENLDFSIAINSSVTLGVFAGLVLGKPIGIALFSLTAVKVFKIPLYEGATKQHIIGAGFLGGIGFTMSLFITGLTFQDPQMTAFAKSAIVAASILSGILGYLVLIGSDSITLSGKSKMQ